MTQERTTPVLIVAPTAAVSAPPLTILRALDALRNASRTPVPAALLLLLLPALACSGDEPPDASPAGASSPTAGDSEILIISDEALNISAPSDRIARIADLAVADDGTVWVLNTTEPLLVAMSADGEVLRSWGKKGDGPGEFAAPGNLVRAGRPSQVWAFDRQHSKLVRADGPEGETEELFLPLGSDPPGRVVPMESTSGDWGRAAIGGLEDGFLFAHRTWRNQAMATLWHFAVTHLAMDASARGLFSTDSLLGDPAARFGERMKELTPFPLWAPCPDGSMGLYDPLTNSVRRLTAAGGEIDSLALGPERRLEVTMESLWALLYPWMMSEAEAAGEFSPDSAMNHALLKEAIAEEGGLEASTSSVFPEYVYLACGGSDGTLWLQVFDMESPGRSLGAGPEWLRIAPGGAIRRVVFPGSFSPLKFTDDRIWGSHRGELDVESVAWIVTPG